MKSKSFTYLLLIIVAIVWYNVFFRIKSNLIGENAILQSNKSQVISLKSQMRDTFFLNANYRDPFEGLNEKLAETNSNLSINSAPGYTIPKINKIEYWPNIKYYGLIKKNSSKKPLCILNFDDVLLNLYEGDYFFDGYKIKAIYTDSLVIQHNRIKKTFYK